MKSKALMKNCKYYTSFSSCLHDFWKKIQDNSYPCSSIGKFFFSLTSRFSFSLAFYNLNMIYLGVDFIYIYIYCAWCSQLSRSVVSVINLVKFAAIVTSNISSASFSLFSPLVFLYTFCNCPTFLRYSFVI